MAECNPGLSQDFSPRELPRHVAIIMDGNRRWAKRRRMPAMVGHEAGADNVPEVARACADMGILHLTLFAFSTENWRRSRFEIRWLMRLLRRLLRSELKELQARSVRVRILGDTSVFAEDIQELMRDLEANTKDNDGMQLHLAANYGGRWDLARATRMIAATVLSGGLRLEDIDEDLLAANLSLANVPAPDLCVRTGGEQRLSNFLLWDLAYAELYFPNVLWPDFGVAALQEALTVFATRKRNYGGR